MVAPRSYARTLYKQCYLLSCTIFEKHEVNSPLWRTQPSMVAPRSYAGTSYKAVLQYCCLAHSPRTVRSKRNTYEKLVYEEAISGTVRLDIVLPTDGDHRRPWNIFVCPSVFTTSSTQKNYSTSRTKYGHIGLSRPNGHGIDSPPAHAAAGSTFCHVTSLVREPSGKHAPRQRTRREQSPGCEAKQVVQTGRRSLFMKKHAPCQHTRRERNPGGAAKQ